MLLLLVVSSYVGFSQYVHQGIPASVKQKTVIVTPEVPHLPVPVAWTEIKEVPIRVGVQTPDCERRKGSDGPDQYYREIRDASLRYGVPHRLIVAVIRVESAFDPNAVSTACAQGLMQLMPATAVLLGVTDSFDPRQNINGGTRHLRYLIKRYNGRVPVALAAYNAGATAVDEYGGIPPFPETHAYVRKIMTAYMAQRW